jgi:endo-1,4-beta-mannosidase
MHFGITTNTGQPKQPLRELHDFAQLLSCVDFPHTSRTDADAALVVTSYLERDYPISTAADRSLAFRTLRQGYVAAREASLPVALSREEDGLARDYQQGVALYLLPCVRQLLAPTWAQLGRLAAAGATVYLSFCSGEQSFHRAFWHAGLDEMFGVEHELAYGLINPIVEDTVELRFTEDFGSIAAGEVLRFEVGGNEHSRAFLPVTPRGAKVVAVDARGRPALLRQTAGSGETVLCTYPLEYLASARAQVNPEPSYRIYDALARVAGVRRELVVADPRVFTDTLVHADGRRFGWFVSQHADEVTVHPETSLGLLPLGTDHAVPSITLPPYGVRVVELVEGHHG